MGKSTEPITLTAIVPVSNMYGRLQLLKQWLHHIEDFPIQVVIVHDSVDERTGVELREIVKNREIQVLLLEGTYGGPGSARNAGIDVASGSWVTFWDSDDLPSLVSVFQMIAGADPSKSVLLGNYSTGVYSERGIEKFSFKQQRTLEDLALNPGIWRWVFKRERIGCARFGNYRMGEDQVFLVRLNLTKVEIAWSDIETYCYVQYEKGQLTKEKKAVLDIEKSIDELFDFEMNYFGKLLYVRLLITSVKKCTINTKLKSLYRLLFYIRIISLLIVRNYKSDFKHERRTNVSL